MVVGRYAQLGLLNFGVFYAFSFFGRWYIWYPPNFGSFFEVSEISKVILKFK